MKVGTDGVLLGAWVNIEHCGKVLDVGTGTGLIALMLAQRNSEASIIAIDIDKGAVEQAESNFSSSIWSDRLNVIHKPLQQFAQENLGGFEHVICNPPFFNKSYKCNNHSRHLARHTDALSYLELIRNAYIVTNKEGKLSVVLPFEVENEFIKLALNEGFYLHRLTRIKPTPSKAFVRILIELSKKLVDESVTNEMIIEDKGRHGYSDDYIAITRKFYLKM